MRYSYEFKRMCVELYRLGLYPETPVGISKKKFRQAICDWVRMEESCGPEVLKHASHNKVWTIEERYSLVARVLSGCSCRSVALSAGISPGLLYQWIKKYQIFGYNGLDCRKGRKPKEPDMQNKVSNKSQKFNESEHEELIRLRAENEYLRTELAVIKKLEALRKEKQAAQLKAKKQR